MAVYQRVSFALVFAAAAALLHFSPLQIDARATPLSHFSIASLTSTISAVPSPAPASEYDAAAPVPAPAYDEASPVPAPAFDVAAPVPAATTQSTGGRGHGLYGRESAVTADELHRIESQLDDDNDEDDDKFVERKPTTPKAYGFGAYPTNGVGTFDRNDGKAERTPVTSTAATRSSNFGKIYSQEESDLDGHNTKTQEEEEEDFFPEFGSGKQASSQSTPATPSKAQAFRFGDDVNLSNNEFRKKPQEPSTQSTANPSPYVAYGRSNNYYNGITNTNQYYGLSDTRKPENQRLYYNAAKGLGATKSYNVDDNEQTANFGYNKAPKVSGTNTKVDGDINYQPNSDRQSRNEFGSMAEYYKTLGIQP